MEGFLKIAHRESRRGDHKQYYFGAVIARRGSILGVGHNTMKTHPLMGPLKRTHAEIAALIRTRPIDIVGATVYVVRTNRNGKIGMARPCPICRTILKQHGITEAQFTTADENIIGVESY
jgi:tRNA(Arg) A34 adenosine deaminase TadA